MPRLLNINTDDTPDQITSVILDQKVFILRLRYNPRGGWQISLYDSVLYDNRLEDNTSAKLYGEHKLMPFQDAFKFAHGDSLPKGQLMLVDNTLKDLSEFKYPDETDLGVGKRFELYYYPENEKMNIPT